MRKKTTTFLIFTATCLAISTLNLEIGLAQRLPAAMTVAGSTPPLSESLRREELDHAFHDAIVMIDHRGAGGGSGAYLGDGWVITCQHLFQSSLSGDSVGRIVVTFPDGRGSEAELIATDSVWDLALIQLRQPPDAADTILFGDAVPQLGEAVYFAGYGGAGKLQIQPASVTGFGGDKHLQTRSQDTLILTGAARPGDSGGPILNRNGQLCGVLWGSNERNVVGTQIGRVWQFAQPYLKAETLSAKRVRSRLPVLSANEVQRGSCAGGTCPLPSVPAPFTYQPFHVSRPTAPPPVSLPESGSLGCDCNWQAEQSKLDNSIAKLQQQLDALQRHCASQTQLASQPGPAGPRGPQGPPGPPAEIDMDSLAERVKQKLAGSLRVRVQPKQ
jgi:hypothetical protein